MLLPKQVLGAGKAADLPASQLPAAVAASRGRRRRRGGGSLARAPGAVAPIPRPLDPPRHSPHPQALPLRVRGRSPPMPSIGQQLKDLWIQRQRRLSHLPLKQDLIHQLPQPRQGAETAAIAQLHQRLGAKRLELGATRLVRMGHEGRSAGHRHQGGAGSRTRAAGLARSGQAWRVTRQRMAIVQDDDNVASGPS